MVLCLKKRTTVMTKSLSLYQFMSIFPTDDSCMEYLAKSKWEAGFSCPNCGHQGYCHPKGSLNRKCNRCKHIASPTSGTLFHKCKFSLQKAFMIIFLISTSKSGISSCELSRKVGLRQKTCYSFKRKVMLSMRESLKLGDHTVQVDEFYVGGPGKGKRGRSHTKNKKLVIMGVETYRNKKVLKGSAQIIDRATSKNIGAFMEKNVLKSAVVKTDKWRGYSPMKKEYPKLEQKENKRGKGLFAFHRQAMMFKAWLRGIHHSVKHLQAYLDEYFFRFNNRIRNIFFLTVKQMIKNFPVNLKTLNLNYGN